MPFTHTVTHSVLTQAGPVQTAEKMTETTEVSVHDLGESNDFSDGMLETSHPSAGLTDYKIPGLEVTDPAVTDWESGLVLGPHKDSLHAHNIPGTTMKTSPVFPMGKGTRRCFSEEHFHARE